ncbi:hypothetical protein ACFQVC_33085 [Streptomyces monticola]|uniref:Uncharacterized protein n=1 Tax=Streptomyces monticola TaxID=2666263 RepID=A0ABW2JS57_9ACTN
MAEQAARQMLPEVQKYVERVEAATSARDAAVTKAHAKYPERYGSGEEARRQNIAYGEELNKAYDMYADLFEAAWDALKSSSDPLAKWIAENCGEYRDQAVTVLAALPATLGELEALAEREDWCGVWDDFKERAIEAGFMPGVDPPSPALVAVFERIDQVSCCRLGRNAKRRIREALDALIQESQAVAASTMETKTVEA